ncbi:MAG: hypothetical protein GXY76_07240 [Chloroflexi bacterium]|nr:hypothetical protein [Chloroflexota bacterium]
MEASEFLTYLGVIRKRLWLILLLMIVTLGVIVAMAVAEPPVYRTTVRLQVVTSDPLFSSVTSDEELIAARNDCADALMATHVAWQTITQLELSIDALDLLGRISVGMEDVFITVNVDTDNPELSFKIAETHVNNALEYYRNERARPASVFRAFLRDQLKEEGQALSEENSKLLDFRVKNNILQPDSEALAVQAMIRDLQLERDRVEIEAIKAEAAAKEFFAKADQAVADAAAARERTADSSAAYFDSLAQRYSTQAITFEASGISSRAAVARYDEMITARRSDLQELLLLGNEYTALDTAVRRADSNYAFLLTKENEARLRESQARSVGFIDILEPARYPDQQAASKLPRLLLLGGVISLLVGIVLAFLLEFLESLGQQPQPSRQ